MTQAMEGCLESCECLLDLGADAAAVCDKGRTPEVMLCVMAAWLDGCLRVYACMQACVYRQTWT